MDLTTIESVQRLLGETEALDADVQDQLEAKIAEVSARAMRFCGREFERIERVSYHDGGGQFLYLTETPVSEVDEILYSYTWEWDAAPRILPRPMLGLQKVGWSKRAIPGRFWGCRPS